MPEESYAIPFAEANVVREGRHATIVTYGQTVHRSIDAANAAGQGRASSARSSTCRTLSPIDMDTVIESVEATGQLICVDEANPRCSIASDVVGDGGAGGLRSIEGADPHGHRAAYAGAVLAVARGSLCSERGSDRGGGAQVVEPEAQGDVR